VPIRAQTLVCVIIFTRRQVPALNVNLGTQPVWILSLRPAQVESTLKLKQYALFFQRKCSAFLSGASACPCQISKLEAETQLKTLPRPLGFPTHRPTLLHNITCVWSRIPSCDDTAVRGLDYMLILLEQLSNASKLNTPDRIFMHFEKLSRFIQCA